VPAHLADVDYFTYIFRDGGSVSYILIALSILTLTWAMMMVVSCRRQTLCPPVLYSQLVEHLGDGNGPAAEQTLARDPSLLARMLEAGLQADRIGEPPDRIDAAASKAGADQFARWSFRIGYLAVAASIAPMLGLFGTVIGMIEAFGTLGLGTRVTQQGELASAISKALITTWEGLLIAIPTLIVYAILRHRLGAVMLEAASRADALLGLWRQSKRTGAKVHGPGVRNEHYQS
jgi:biopolymer transport protein ExbB